MEKTASNIEDTNWEVLSATPPSKGDRLMTEKQLHITEDDIPKCVASIRKSTHPWLTEGKRERQSGGSTKLEVPNGKLRQLKNAVQFC